MEVEYSDYAKIGAILNRAEVMAANGVLDQVTVDSFVEEIGSLLSRGECYLVDRFRLDMEVLIDPEKKQKRDQDWAKRAELGKWARQIMARNKERFYRDSAQSTELCACDVPSTLTKPVKAIQTAGQVGDATAENVGSVVEMCYRAN